MTPLFSSSLSSMACRKCSLQGLILSILLLIQSLQIAQCQETSDNGDVAYTHETDTFTGKTTPESFHIAVEHLESSTSHIKIAWKVPGSFRDDVSNYIVTSKKTNADPLTKSGNIEPGENEYVIEDLARDTEYKICITATVTLDNKEQEEVECEFIATVPIISAKSLIILFCVLAYIILMILIGWCVWRQAMKKALASMAEKDEEEEAIKPNEHPQTYLAPPANNAPKSSIEDQDIPYITPPVSQLSPTEKDSYNKALV